MDDQAKKVAIERGADHAGYDSPTLLEKLEAERLKYEEAENEDMEAFMAELIRKITAEKRRMRRTAEAKRKARKRQKSARKKNR